MGAIFGANGQANRPHEIGRGVQDGSAIFQMAPMANCNVAKIANWGGWGASHYVCEQPGTPFLSRKVASLIGRFFSGVGTPPGPAGSLELCSNMHYFADQAAPITRTSAF